MGYESTKNPYMYDNITRYKLMGRLSIIIIYFLILVSYKAIHFRQHCTQGTRIQSAQIKMQ